MAQPLQTPRTQADPDNGSTDHADKVLQRLGIGAHFEAVFDIIAAELEPKPAPQTYQKFLGITGSIQDVGDVRRISPATSWYHTSSA